MQARTGGGVRPYSPLILILLARLALGLAFSQVVPVWESYDEDGHFAYARYLAQHRALVLPPGDPETEKIWEKFQPPLYYDVIAPLLAAFDLGRTFEGPPRNPHFAAGDAGVNYALHPAELTSTERSIERAVRTARAASVVISTLSVVCVYLAARRLWPAAPRTGLAATCLYAFWPQFLFVGSMLTNDVLVTALSALALLLAISLAVDGFQAGRALLLALVIGAALLTKLNAAALLPVAVAALGLSLARQPSAGPATGLRSAQRWLGLASLAGLVAAAIWLLSSLKFVTSQVLQLATLTDFVQNLGPGSQANAAGLLSAALPYAFRTYLASYGWGNLETYPWMYGLWSLGAALAMVGLALAVWRATRRVRAAARPPRAAPRIYGLFALHGLSLLALTLALAIANQSVYLVPGRYLLPSLPGVACLLVGGWRALLPAGRARRFAWQLLSLGLVGVAWLTPLRILLPAYARPKPLDLAQARIDKPLAMFFGNSIELLGYDNPRRAVAGDRMDVSLCWQAVAPVAIDYTLFLEVVGADNQGYGRLSTFPGRGNYPTSQWVANQPFCERYTFPMGAAIPAPALAHLRIVLVDDSSEQALPVTDFSAAPQLEPEVNVPFKVEARGPAPAVAQPVDYRFGAPRAPSIRLTGFEVVPDGQDARVTLRWEALKPISANYVVFVHLRDTPETPYGLVGDSQPRQGAYPTWLWQPGESLLDEHWLDLPDAASRPTPPLDLYVGLYDVDTAERVPAFDSEGNQLANDEVILERGLVFP